eukprot:Gb_38527 [translate_table: standard]
MENDKPILGVVGVPQSEPKNGGCQLIDNTEPPSLQQQREKSPVMNALKDAPAAKNPSMDQNPSKSPSHIAGQNVTKSHNNRDMDRVVSLLNDFQSMAPPLGSAHQQALQQQALHQQALHQQALKQHAIQSVGFHSSLHSRQNQTKENSQQKQSGSLQNQDPSVKAEPTDIHEFAHLDNSGGNHEVIEIDDGKGKEEEREHDFSRRQADGDEVMQGQSQSTSRATAVFADLNVEPPLSDGEDPVRSDGTKIAVHPDCSRGHTEPTDYLFNCKGLWATCLLVVILSSVEYIGAVKNLQKDEVKCSNLACVHCGSCTPKNLLHALQDESIPPLGIEPWSSSDRSMSSLLGQGELEAYCDDQQHEATVQSLDMCSIVQAGNAACTQAHSGGGKLGDVVTCRMLRVVLL